MFRRRRRGEPDRRGGLGQAGPEEETWTEDEDESADEFDDEAELAGTGPEEAGPAGEADGGASPADPGPGSGPWDGAGRYPDRERLDFGSMLVPPRAGLDIQINMAEEQGVWVAIVRGDSAMQLQAFAAPKTSGLWDEVRQEICEEVARAGGESREARGPFGPELHARIAPAAAGAARQARQPVRFLGVDGPRWFLRGLISGPAAEHPEVARPFEELFADVVVVRGDHPAPPRDLLEIRLPEDAQRALDEQLDQASQQGYPNPFERGPEITETR